MNLKGNFGLKILRQVFVKEKLFVQIAGVGVRVMDRRLTDYLRLSRGSGYF
jgi:hypothetical protein